MPRVPASLHPALTPLEQNRIVVCFTIFRGWTGWDIHTYLVLKIHQIALVTQGREVLGTEGWPGVLHVHAEPQTSSSVELLGIAALLQAEGVEVAGLYPVCVVLAQVADEHLAASTVDNGVLCIERLGNSMVCAEGLGTAGTRLHRFLITQAADSSDLHSSNAATT